MDGAGVDRKNIGTSQTLSTVTIDAHMNHSQLLTSCDTQHHVEHLHADAGRTELLVYPQYRSELYSDSHKANKLREVMPICA